MNTGKSTFQQLVLEPDDARRLARLCGQFGENLQQIECQLDIRIRNRGNQFTLEGSQPQIAVAGRLLNRLYQETGDGRELDSDTLQLMLQQSQLRQLPHSPQLIQTRRTTVKVLGTAQRNYLSALAEHDINFAIGPAGTGKTYLAVAFAVAALERQEVQRLVLTRPAVEAGERLGFLPGDLQQKVVPYLRPLYDALYEMLGMERVGKLVARNVIEVAPLAYMRGRSLNHCYAILDEGQNTTAEQMKMFLTRMGVGSRAVITGDVTQVDLPRGTDSGLAQAIRILDGVEGIGFSWFNSKDVIRHSLVRRIVEAYNNHDSVTAKAFPPVARSPE